jgi:hypothetical protein
MSNIWGFSSSEDGVYFSGAAGTFNNGNNGNNRADEVIPGILGGPLPGQDRPKGVRPRSFNNYALPSAPKLNYATIASRARTEDDIRKETEAAAQQEQLIRRREEEQQRNFLARSNPQPSTEGGRFCHFYPLGTCKYGEYCRYEHSDPITTANPGLFTNSAEYTTEYEPESALAPAPVLIQPPTITKVIDKWAEANECGICMGDTPSDAGLYGILSHCNCVFCLSCIREWRADGNSKHNQTMATSTVRQCPLCRITSYFVVPSTRTFTLQSLVGSGSGDHKKTKECCSSNGDIETGTVTGDGTGDEIMLGEPTEKERQLMLQNEKEKFINAYKTSLTRKPCRNYLKDKTCPFGSSCFYLHIDGNGEIEKDAREELDITTKPRYILNSLGETVVIGNSTGMDIQLR